MDPNYYQQLQQAGAQAATAPSQWSGIGQAQGWGGLLGASQAPYQQPMPPAYTSEYVIHLQALLVDTQRRFLELHEKYEELLKFKEWTQPGEQAKAATP